MKKYTTFASRKIRTSALLFASGLLMAVSINSAYATNPASPVEILDLESSSIAAPGRIRIRIKSDTIENLEIETSVFQRSQMVTQKRSKGLSIVKPDSAIAKGTLPPGLVVAGKEDVLTISQQHQISLFPGVYVERVVVTIIEEGLEPRQMAFHRHFEITEKGLVPISSTEYSQRVTPIAAYKNGKQYIVGQGVKDEQPKKNRDKEIRIEKLIESSDTGAASDQSEANAK